MNNKGFTLVELLVTLLLLGIIATISITGVISVMTNSKNSEYKVLIKNIETGAKMFYEDCEYGTLVGNSVCNKTEDTEDTDNTYIYTIELSVLTKYGFLTGNSSGQVINPKDNKNISGCEITIKYKNKDYFFTYNGKYETDENGNKISKVDYKKNYFESCGT